MKHTAHHLHDSLKAAVISGKLPVLLASQFWQHYSMGLPVLVTSLALSEDRDISAQMPI